MNEGAVPVTVQRSNYATIGEAEQRHVPVEAPIAIEINGVAYAVMMATPCDLENFVTGFLLSEGLAEASEIGEVALHVVAEGFVARVNLPEHRLAPIMERARRRLGDSSCGICGIESIEAALRPLPAIVAPNRALPAAILKLRKSCLALEL